MGDETTHKLQQDPPEGSRETVENQLRRQDNRRAGAGAGNREEAEPATHRLQEEPPEGSRETVENQLRRQENRRETGARKREEAEPDDEGIDIHASSDAALPDKPEPYGLTEEVDQTQADTRQSGGVGSVAEPGLAPQHPKGTSRDALGWGDEDDTPEKD